MNHRRLSSGAWLAAWAMGLVLSLGLLLGGGAPAWAKPSKAEQAAPAPAAKAASPPACLEPAHQAMGQRDFPRAAELLAACARQNPKDPQLWHLLGMAHFLAHQPAPAVEAFEKCLALLPDHLGAMGMLGKLYSFDKAKLAQAEELLDKALKMRPDWEDARFDLARVYALTDRYDQSFRQFNALFQGEIRFALYHTELGKVFVSLGLTKEARQEFTRALALQPDFSPARDQLKALEEKAPGGKPEAKPSR